MHRTGNIFILFKVMLESHAVFPVGWGGGVGIKYAKLYQHSQCMQQGTSIYPYFLGFLTGNPPIDTPT